MLNKILLVILCFALVFPTIVLAEDNTTTSTQTISATVNDDNNGGAATTTPVVIETTPNNDEDSSAATTTEVITTTQGDSLSDSGGDSATTTSTANNGETITEPTTPQGYCGDGICQDYESSGACPQDCGQEYYTEPSNQPTTTVTPSNDNNCWKDYDQVTGCTIKTCTDQDGNQYEAGRDCQQQTDIRCVQQSWGNECYCPDGRVTKTKEECRGNNFGPSTSGGEHGQGYAQPNTYPNNNMYPNDNMYPNNNMYPSNMDPQPYNSPQPQNCWQDENGQQVCDNNQDMYNENPMTYAGGQDRKDDVMRQLNDFEFYDIEKRQWDLDDLKDQGVSCKDGKNILEEMKSIVSKAKEYMNQGEYDKADNIVNQQRHEYQRKIDRAIRTCQQQQDIQRIKNDLKQRIKDTGQFIDDIKWRMEDMEYDGVNTTDARNEVAEFEKFTQDIMNKMDTITDARDAERLQHEFEHKAKHLDAVMHSLDSRRPQGPNIQDMKSQAEDIKYRIEDAKLEVSDAEKRGVDVTEAKELIKKAEYLLPQLTASINKKDYDKARQQLRDFEMIGKRFGSIMGDSEGPQGRDMNMQGDHRNMRAPREQRNVIDDLKDYSVQLEDKIYETAQYNVDVSEAKQLLDQLNSEISDIEKTKDSMDDSELKQKTKDAFRIGDKIERILNRLEERDFSKEDLKKKTESILADINENLPKATDRLTELSNSGVDTSSANEIITKIRSSAQQAQAQLDQGEYKNALDTLKQAFPLGERLKSFISKYEQYSLESSKSDASTTIHKDLEESLAMAEVRIPKAEAKLQEYKSKGIDTTRAEKLIENIKSIVSEAKDSYDQGNSEEAWQILKTGFVLGEKLERAFGTYDNMLYAQNPQQLQAKVTKILTEADKLIPNVKTKLETLKAQGKDTSKAEAILTSIETLVQSAHNKADSGDYNSAQDVLKAAFILGNDLKTVGAELLAS